MSIRTEVCDLLGIEYPVFQGGMAWVATAELAAAVSEAGGLGIIGAGNMPSEALRTEIRKARLLTDKPFAVNLLLLAPHIADLVDMCCGEGVAAVTTGAGNPGVFMEALKAHNVKVMPVVPSVALAQRMERAGADAVVVEGTEAGGHVGELTTMVLVPQVVDAVRVPVIAAGGVADGRGFAAALMLGARGVQVGTRFVCATECTVHESYKRVIIEAGDRATVVTGRSTGHPVRCIKNRLSREFDQLEKECVPPEELEKLGSGKLQAAVKGDVDHGSVMAGQSAGLVTRIEPAADIIKSLVGGAEDILADRYREFAQPK